MLIPDQLQLPMVALDYTTQKKKKIEKQEKKKDWPALQLKSDFSLASKEGKNSSLLGLMALPLELPCDIWSIQASQTKCLNSFFKEIIYIYIYICVCVCVWVCGWDFIFGSSVVEMSI